ncbi:MAG TPA: hypothetical protein VLA51_09200, partial [Paracoccaceae bacterium]|nr:hypothetical protein [Paracoccaceae bacterium]
MRLVFRIFCTLFLLLPLATTAQEQPGFLAGLLEDQLSDVGRTVKIRDVRGALRSKAEIGEITVADREGVWLRITDAVIDWNRSALFSGSLSINTLAAQSIEVSRKPVPVDGIPSPESGGFSIPALPVSINIGLIEAGKVSFGEDLFGLESAVSLTGAMTLEEGSLNASLNANRLDGPGGRIALAVDFRADTKVLTVETDLSEPANGILANALNIEGKPPVALQLNGSGPLDNFIADLGVATDQGELVQGALTLIGNGEGRSFDLDVTGQIASMIPADIRAFFSGTSSVKAAGRINPEGGFNLSALDITTGAVTLRGQAKTGADGFLQFLKVDGTIGGQSQPVALPGGNGDVTLQSATVEVGYDTATSDRWQVELALKNLVAGDTVISDAALEIDGLISNPQDAAKRKITAQISGDLSGEAPSNPALQLLLENRPTLRGNIDWMAGQPVRVQDFSVASAGLSATIDGLVDGLEFKGGATVAVEDLSAFSQVAGTPLAGAASVEVAGALDILGGGFDLTVTGTSRDLSLGLAQADAMLTGTTALDGRVVRDADGLRSDHFTLSNPQADINVQGWLKTNAAIAALSINLPDAAILVPGLTGEVSLTGEVLRAGDSVQSNVTLTGQNDITAEVDGVLRLSDKGLDFQGKIGNLPLDIFNTFAPELGLNGVLSANFGVGGTLDEPRANFAAQGSGLRADMLDAFNLGSVQASILGSYLGKTIGLQGISVRTSSGMNASAKGSVPLDGSDMEITAQGIIPLNIVNAFLIDRSARAGGLLDFTGRVTGPLSDPAVFGNGTIAGGSFVDPNTQVRLYDVASEVELSGQSIILKSATA